MPSKAVCRNFAGQSFANVVQLGDYEGYELASMVFEDFMKAVVIFISQVYHQRRHRGLEYFTPYSRWQLLASEHEATPLPDTAQQLVAFGFRHNVPVTLDKHGMDYLGLSYTTPDTEALGVLMRNVGYGAKLAIIVNPNDIGSILVHVADAAHREAIASVAGGALYGEFLELSAGPEWRGVTLPDRVLTKAEVNAMAKAEQANGKAFRIAGNAHLFEHGRQIIDLLGIDHHGLTQDEANQLATQIDWTTVPGQDRVDYGQVEAEVEPESFGQPVATPTKTRPIGKRKPDTQQPVPSTGI